MKNPDSIQQLIHADENEIIEAAKNDPVCFKPLYEKYFKRIFLFVYHRVEDRDMAADLTSQIFLKVMQRIHQYQSRGLPFSSWLYRIAVNECTDYFRKAKRSKVVYVEEVSFHHLFDEMFPEDPRDELEKKLHIVLQQLKPNELQIIELRYFEEMPFKMVAEILNISEVNAKVRTYRALDKMKRIFLKQL
ncbi:MAG TPA: sigma-70 family RNA polymerase sigma factor [Cyclobacteriaceae bacterium]|nr:sigma-70 family RNA polymerase sigma factor [Cyclobacteriaceae bacterium]